MAKKRKFNVKRRSEAEKDADTWNRTFADADTDQSYGHGVSAVRWWSAEDSDTAAGRLWLWIERLRLRWAVDGIQDLIHEAIYADEPLGLGFDGTAGVYGYGGVRFPRQAPANLNVLMSIVDTAAARLCKRRPMPVISAVDASWTSKLFAKRCSRSLRVRMGSSAIEAASPQVIRDFCVRGTGIWNCDRDNGDVTIGRAPIYEFVFDPREAYYNEVRSVSHTHPVARELLIARYPWAEEEIRTAPAFNRSDPWMMYVYQGPTFADHVEVAHAIHLPSSPGAPDGQEIVCIRGTVLMRKFWRYPRFPWPRCFWSPPFRGWRGRGLVQQLAGMQMKVNDLARDMQEASYYGSMLKIFVQRGSNIIKNHLRAKHPAVIEYDGVEPHYVAPNPISEQSFKLILMIIDQMYKISGVSEMAAHAKNTLGSNASGRAIDTMDDIQSDRFAHVELGYGSSRCELGRVQIDRAKELYEEAKRGEIDKLPEWPGGNPVTMDDLAAWIREIEWDKLEIDEGGYSLTLEPINFLPDSRAGRLSFVAELAKGGLIPDPTMTAALFDEPDIQRMNRPMLGAIHNIERMIEDIGDTGVPLQNCLPSEYSNLALFKLMAQGELEEAQALRVQEHDPEVIERFDQVIKYVKDLQDQMTAQPSLPGMQSAQMGPSPNAATLPPGAIPGAGPTNGAAGPPMIPPGMPPIGPQ